MLTDKHYKLIRSRNTYDKKSHLSVLQCSMDEVMMHVHTPAFDEEFRSKVSNNPLTPGANEEALNLMKSGKCEMFILSNLLVRDTGQPKRTKAYNLLGCEGYTEFFTLWMKYKGKIKGEKADTFEDTAKIYHDKGHATAEEFLVARTKRDTSIDEFKKRTIKIAKEIIAIDKNHIAATDILYFYGDDYDAKYSDKTFKQHEKIYGGILRMKEALK